MDAKRILKWSLLVFVGVSLAVGISKSRKEMTRHTPSAGTAMTEPAKPPKDAPALKDASASPPTKKGPQKVLVYYFHGNARCYSCKTIEKLTRESVQEGITKKMFGSQVELKAVNVETRENSHFIKDYRLVAKSVIIQKLEGQEPADWKNLDRIWILVRDKEAFCRYIQTEIKSILKT